MIQKISAISGFLGFFILGVLAGSAITENKQNLWKFENGAAISLPPSTSPAAVAAAFTASNGKASKTTHEAVEAAALSNLKK